MLGRRVVDDFVPGSIHGLLPDVETHKVIARRLVACRHGVPMATLPGQIRPSMKGVDAVGEQCARGCGCRFLAGFECLLMLRLRHDFALTKNARAVGLFDIVECAQVVGHVREVDDEVDRAERRILTGDGQRVVAEVAVMMLVIIRFI